MIESLQSPHVARVKALLSSKKERLEQNLFIAEGIQAVREALKEANGIDSLYLTKSGVERLAKANVDYSAVKCFEIDERVADAMSDAITTQGIIAICKLISPEISELTNLSNEHIIYLSEIQDPGNAGTILRTADAMGLPAVITSPGSVDFYSPKVVRSTAGSLWHTKIFTGLELEGVTKALPNHRIFILDGAASKKLTEIDFSKPAIWIFGNEARGFNGGISSDSAITGAEKIAIKMSGNAESLNLAAAAAIVMHEISREK